MNNLSTLLILLVVLIGFTQSSVSAQSGLETVKFEREAQVGEQMLPLRGDFKLRVWGFDVYSIALYVPPTARGVDAILNEATPKKLKLIYHRSIDAKDIIKASEKNLEENPNVDKSKYREQLDKTFDCLKSVKRNDIYEVIYKPGDGFRLIFNGEEECHVNDDEFAQVFFGLWLSEYSINDRMARRLRGE